MRFGKGFRIARVRELVIHTSTNGEFFWRTDTDIRNLEWILGLGDSVKTFQRTHLNFSKLIDRLLPSFKYVKTWSADFIERLKSIQPAFGVASKWEARQKFNLE